VLEGQVDLCSSQRLSRVRQRRPSAYPSEWYAISSSHISSTHRPTAHPPSPTELLSDLDDQTQSIRSLVSLVLTSASFHLILSSLFSATREIVAYTASIVGDVAAWVEVEANEVERAAKRGEVRLGEAKETIGDAWAGLGNIAGGTYDESVDRLKDEIIGKVQEKIIRAPETYNITIWLTLLYDTQDHSQIRYQTLHRSLFCSKRPANQD
jgi:hypothetical protein